MKRFSLKPKRDGKKEKMGEIADDMIDGLMCSFCGTYFEEEHGYPVVCRGCWAGLTSQQIITGGHQKAVHKEI